MNLDTMVQNISTLMLCACECATYHFKPTNAIRQQNDDDDDDDDDYL